MSQKVHESGPEMTEGNGTSIGSLGDLRNEFWALAWVSGSKNLPTNSIVDVCRSVFPFIIQQRCRIQPRNTLSPSVRGLPGRMGELSGRFTTTAKSPVIRCPRQCAFRIIAVRREPSGFGALENRRACALPLDVVCIRILKML